MDKIDKKKDNFKPEYLYIEDYDTQIIPTKKPEKDPAKEERGYWEIQILPKI